MNKPVEMKIAPPPSLQTPESHARDTGGTVKRIVGNIIKFGPPLVGFALLALGGSTEEPLEEPKPTTKMSARLPTNGSYDDQFVIEIDETQRVLRRNRLTGAEEVVERKLGGKMTVINPEVADRYGVVRPAGDTLHYNIGANGKVTEEKPKEESWWSRWGF